MKNNPIEPQSLSAVYSLNRVEFRYGEHRVLTDIDLTVEPGEILGIVGPNGSGKTSLLKILGGHFRPRAGEVRFESRNLATVRPDELARQVSMVPQEHEIVFAYTALEIVLMGRYPHLHGWAFETAEDHRIARSAMERMEVDGLAHRLFNELSGGEKQRVIIARALAQQPKVLLLDEPSTFLDLHHQMKIYALLRELNRRDGLTLVMVSHDLNMASQLCHRLLMLKDGRIAGIGAPREVLTEPMLREVYHCSVLVDSHPVTGHPRVTLVPQ